MALCRSISCNQKWMGWQRVRKVCKVCKVCTKADAEDAPKDCPRLS